MLLKTEDIFLFNSEMSSTFQNSRSHYFGLKNLCESLVVSEDSANKIIWIKWQLVLQVYTKHLTLLLSKLMYCTNISSGRPYQSSDP